MRSLHASTKLRNAGRQTKIVCAWPREVVRSVDDQLLSQRDLGSANWNGAQEQFTATNTHGRIDSDRGGHGVLSLRAARKTHDQGCELGCEISCELGCEFGYKLACELRNEE